MSKHDHTLWFGRQSADGAINVEMLANNEGSSFAVTYQETDLPAIRTVYESKADAIHEFYCLVSHVCRATKKQVSDKKPQKLPILKLIK